MQIGATPNANSTIVSQNSGRNTAAVSAGYTPDDIGSIHRAPQDSFVETLSKAPPRILNTGMQWLSRIGRIGTACIAGIGAACTGLSLLLFNAKIAFLFALPTLAALAAFIGLKPKEEMHLSLQAKNQDLLETIASGANPERILSRTDDVIKALQNLRNNWGSVILQKRPALLRTIENLKGKIQAYYESTQELAAQAKDGLTQTFPACSIEKLKTMLDLVTESSTDLAAHLASKTGQVAEPDYN